MVAWWHLAAAAAAAFVKGITLWQAMPLAGSPNAFVSCAACVRVYRNVPCPVLGKRSTPQTFGATAAALLLLFLLDAVVIAPAGV